MEEYFGFVLFLAPTDNEVLLPIITNLQSKYCDEPPFEPHLSIYHSVKMTSLTDTISAVTKAVGNIKPFTVESEGFGYQEHWSRILYIKIKPNQILATIRESIRKELGDTETRKYIPHISLMYKDKLDLSERDSITSNLSLPSVYSVHGLHILSPGTPNNDWRDYTKWEVLYSITFPK